MNREAFMHKNENKVIELYLNNKIMGIKVIAKELQMCPKTVKKILIRNNIKIKPNSFVYRRYNVNDDFLDKLNKEQAYFIGWIASDGSVHKNNEIVLRLQDRDKDVIEKIKQLLNFEGPIRFDKIAGKERNGIIARRNSYGISIANEKLANSLRSMKFNENKSYNLSFPDFLKLDLIPHYLRSFIEGDGSIIYVKKANNLYVSFCSTKKFCRQFRKFIKNQLDINVFIEPVRYDFDGNKNISKTHSRCVINGNCNSLIFLNYIYKNAFLYMNRKYNHFKDVVNQLSVGNPKIKTREQINISELIIKENAQF